MEKLNKEEVDVRGTVVLTFAFLIWFILVWVINMVMLAGTWPVH